MGGAEDKLEGGWMEVSMDAKPQPTVSDYTPLLLCLLLKSVGVSRHVSRLVSGSSLY